MSLVADNTLPANSPPVFCLLAKPSGSPAISTASIASFCRKHDTQTTDKECPKTLETYTCQGGEPALMKLDPSNTLSKSLRSIGEPARWSKEMTPNRIFRLCTSHW
jgi:hypothetical protein